MEGRVDEGAGVAFEEVVVGGAVEEEGHLLHVGRPVNLRVYVETEQQSVSGVWNGGALDGQHCDKRSGRIHSQCLHGTFQMTRAQSTVSPTRRQSVTHLECFGFVRRSMAML